MGERKKGWFLGDDARWIVIAVIVACVQIRGCDHEKRLTAIEAAQQK